MIGWQTIRSLIKWPGAERKLRLSDAYQKLFAGNGSREDAETVLADLAQHTGFYQVTPADMSPDQRAFAEGMRAAYGRIDRFLNLPAVERDRLISAVREDTMIANEQGDSL